MIDCPPQVVALTVYPDEDLVQVPAQVPKAQHSRHAPPTSLGGEHWTEPVPPVPHRLMANVDPALEHQVFNVPQRDSWKRTYSITTRRITSGNKLK